MKFLSKNSILFLLCCFFVPLHSQYSDKKYEHTLAITCIFADCARYMKEWIEFHRMVGVSKFYLYNNLSKDDYKAVLQPYIDQGIVELYEWDYTWSKPGEFEPIKHSAYRDALTRAQSKVQWVAVIDSDEFLVPVEKNTLTEFLEDYQDYGAVCLNWQMYGTSHVPTIPTNKLMVECLMMKAPTNMDPENRHVKSIVQTKYVQIPSINDHFCLFNQGKTQTTPSKVSFHGPFSPSIEVDKARVNHYWTREEDFYYNYKLPFRLQWDANPKALEQYNYYMIAFNSVEDRIMDRFIPALRLRMGLVS
ncbi:glycosyltransferase family 92 protein [Vermiphilus pyriformis]|nr:MAG: glycosyltransferase family 92 protein [Vermiphilus pyriformis]